MKREGKSITSSKCQVRQERKRKKKQERDSEGVQKWKRGFPVARARTGRKRVKERNKERIK